MDFFWTSWLGFVLISFTALLLRMHDLEARPFHTDEAVQGVKTGGLLEGEGYRYDPQEYHGPTLYYAAALLARLRGETTLSILTERTLRLVPVLFSLATLALLLLWVPIIGHMAVFWAAVFTILSPIQLYYSRYFIQEPLLVFFTFAFVTCLARYLHRPNWRWAVTGGLALGLMLATKETAVVYAAVPGLLFLRQGFRDPATPFPQMRKHLLYLILAAAFTWLLFFSSFFQHPRGLADSLLTFRYSSIRAGGQGHEKPAWTYLIWLFGWRSASGMHSEALLPLLSLVLLWPQTGRSVSRPLLAATGLVIALFSLIPYKTPWLMLVPMQWLALTAGCGAAALLRRIRGRKSAGLVWLFLITASLHLGITGYAYRDAADERTPYAYSHTDPGFVPQVDPLLAALHRLPEDGPIIYVGAREYWPLPWTLRREPRVGYWNTLPPRLDAPLLFLGEAETLAAAPLLLLTHRPAPIPLRPGVTLTAWIRDEEY